MAGLVQQRAHVAVDADSVHEDQRKLSEVQRLAVTARRLALAIVEVEQVVGGHGVEVATELRIDVSEDGAGAIDQAPDVVERLEWRPAVGINRRVPGSELVQSHPAPAFLVNSNDGGQHRLFDRHVKTHAVFGRVIEAVFLPVGEIAEVREAGVPGDLLPEVVHPVEDAGQDAAVFDVSLCAQLEGPLAHLAIVGLQKRQELRRRLLLAVPLNSHGAVDLGPLGPELGELREQRHVRRVEKLHLVVEPLDGRL